MSTAGAFLPYDYVMVAPKTEEEWIPLYGNLDDMKAEMEPVFKLKKGDTVAVKREPPLKWKGIEYFVAEDGYVG